MGDVTQLGPGINKRLYREEDREVENRKLERPREGRSASTEKMEETNRDVKIKAVERKIKGRTFFKAGRIFYLNKTFMN